MDPARVAELVAEIERIEHLVETDHPDAAEAIARINESTGHDYGSSDFGDFYERSVEDLAREAARPAHPVVADVSRDELVELVRRSRLPTEDCDYYRLLFDVNVVQMRMRMRMRLRATERRSGSPDPAIAFQVGTPSDPFVGRTAEETVDAALRRRSVAL